MKIEGAVALVTGANRGIGQAFVAELLRRGAAKVYAGARDVANVQDDDPRVVAVALDVTDFDRIATLAVELGDVQLVVNNAGIARPALPLGVSLDDARAEFEVNLFGLIATTQAFAPVLAANGGGAIVNVLSVSSWVSTPILATYSATKAAAWAYANAARIQLKGQGTHVVGVHVGPVDTDLQAGNDGEKVAPGVVAAMALDAVVAGEPEAIVDDLSRWVKAGMADEHTLVYPKIEQDFAVAAAATEQGS